MGRQATWIPVCVLVWAVTAARSAPPCPPLATMTDEQRLTLNRCIPLGSDSESVRATGVVRSCHDVTSVYGQPVELILRFDEGRLRSIGYGTLGPVIASDSLQELLGKYYSQLWGEPSVHDLGADGKTVRVTLWSGPECDVILTRFNDGPQGFVGWGLERPGTWRARLDAAEHR